MTLMHTRVMKYTQVTVFGASGRVGRLVVSDLLAGGYTVVGAVRNVSSLNPQPNLIIRKADIYDQASVEAAIRSSDAVISTLGSWGTTKKDILSSGMASIIPAMEAQSIERIITLTGAEARAPGDHLGIIHRMMHTFLGIMAGKVLVDGEKHIALLAGSQLDWTAVRSPIMIAGASSKSRLNAKRPYPWSLIRRQSVVRALLSCLETDSHVKEAPFCH